MIPANWNSGQSDLMSRGPKGEKRPAGVIGEGITAFTHYGVDNLTSSSRWSPDLLRHYAK